MENELFQQNILKQDKVQKTFSLKWFISAHSRIKDPILQKQASLLSSILLATITALVTIVTIVLILDPSDITDPDVETAIFISAISIGLYILNRFGYVQIASILFSTVIAVATILLPIVGADTAWLIQFAIINVLIIGMFFSLRITLIATIIMLASIFFAIQAKGTDFKNYYQMLNTWYFLLLGSALLITFIQHIRALERLRRAELEETNKQLNIFANNLEHQVAERTRDLAEAKDLAEQARQEAEQANAVKSMFLASMSHELRTPLNAIINFTKFVSRGVMGEVNERQVNALSNVIGSGEHLLALINDVLDISKIESGSLTLFLEEGVNIQELLDTSQQTALGLLAEKPVELKMRIDDNLPYITCDRQRILQALLNILSNACKFTSQGSITLTAKQEEQHILFAIADTGPGIAPEDYAAVFETFKQTSTGLRQGGGTGLGMPISKSLIEAHHGQMWLESVLNQGTTFYFTLPIAQPNLRPSQKETV